MHETEKIWMNGELVPWADAKVHVLSHAMHYGSGVFEGIRAYATDRGPAVFRLMDHLRRLERSGEVYFMQLPYSIEELRQATHDVIAANGLDTCYVRPLAFRGYGELGINPLNCPVDVIIAVWPWGAYLGEEALEHGVRVMTSSWRRIGPNTLPAAAKASGQYLNSQLAKMEAMHSGYDEAILLNEQGYLADGSGENVFVVRDGVLTTPPTTASCLPGITRDTVIRIARGMGYEVREVDVVRTDLYHADEVFFTGTAAEITPIRSIDDHEVGAGPDHEAHPDGVLRDHLRPLASSRPSTWTTPPRRPPRREGRGGAPDSALAARHRAAGGGVRARRAALGHARARPVRAQLREGVRGLLRQRARRRGLERHGRPAPARARGRHRRRATRSSPRRSRSSPRPTACSTSARRRSSPTSIPTTFVLDPAAVEAADHAAHARDPAGARVRLPVRHGRARRDRREARRSRSSRTPARRSAASAAAGASAARATRRSSRSTRTSR